MAFFGDFSPTILIGTAHKSGGGGGAGVQVEGRRKRRPGLSADIPVSVLPVPTQEEGPEGKPGRRGGDAGPH